MLAFVRGRSYDKIDGIKEKLSPQIGVRVFLSIAICGVSFYMVILLARNYALIQALLR